MKKMNYSGLSTSVSLILALIVTMILGGLAVAIFTNQSQSISNVVREEVAGQVQKMAEDISMVYWIGSELMLKNEGETPVTIVKVFTEQGVQNVNLPINPGEKKTLTVPQSEMLVLQTSSGSIIKLKTPQPSSSQTSSGGLEIIEGQATKVGGNAQIKIKVKNTSDQTIYSISISIVGENGKTYVSPRNWLLNPGEEVQDTTVLSISEYGTQYYVRVHGFLTEGGREVSDAVWLTLS